MEFIIKSFSAIDAIDAIQSDSIRTSDSPQKLIWKLWCLGTDFSMPATNFRAQAVDEFLGVHY